MKRITVKRLSALVMAMLLALSIVIVTPVTALATDEITVTIDGVPVVFADQGPIIVQGRTLVPVRDVFEALGFEVDWNRAEQQAELTRHDYEIIIPIGSRTFTTNGVSHTLDVQAQIINGRTMLPLRLVLESVGYELDWDGSTRTVIITSPTDDEAALAAFIADNNINLDLARLALGTDFTIGTTEYRFRPGETVWYRRLELHGEMDLIAGWQRNGFTAISIVPGLELQYGDVFLTNGAGGLGLLIYWNDYYTWMFSFGTVSMEPQHTILTEADRNLIRETLGVDFTETQVEFRNYQDTNHWSFLDLQGHTFTADDFTNAYRGIRWWRTYPGDVFVLNQGGELGLFIHLHPCQDDPDNYVYMYSILLR